MRLRAESSYNQHRGLGMWKSGKNVVVPPWPRQEIQTVLVLGAGASAHLGYPLGTELTGNIIKNTGDRSGSSFQQLVEMGFDKDLICTFSEECGKSVAPSIDEFLSHRPDFVDVGRACIAQELIKYEDDQPLRSRNNNWYACWLRDQAKQAIEANISGPLVVTFNYDRSLDKFLYDFVSSTYPGRADSLLRDIVVFHVHGRLGYLDHEAARGFARPYSKRACAADIRTSSEGIRVPAQLEDDYGREMLLAQRAVKQAKRVIFLGFGYDPTNLERLRVGDWAGTNKYFGTAYHLPPLRYEELLQESRLRLGDANTQILEYLSSLTRSAK